MVNAHPVILNCVCKLSDVTIKSQKKKETKDGVSVETIKPTALDTCCDRDAKLMELCEEDNMTKSEAKMLFIKSLNTEYKV